MTAVTNNRQQIAAVKQLIVKIKAASILTKPGLVEEAVLTTVDILETQQDQIDELAQRVEGLERLNGVL